MSRTTSRRGHSRRPPTKSTLKGLINLGDALTRWDVVEGTGIRGPGIVDEVVEEEDNKTEDYLLSLVAEED